MHQTETPLQILIVEDEPSFRLSTKLALTEHGYVVHACETGEDAIQILSEKTFDVILLDYRLPGISGLNVFQWMHEQKLATPVIVMTGEGTETIAVEFMKLGAYDYLRKELHDRLHLPILINGVYERYLFKREKEERQRMQGGTEKNVLILEMFSKGVTSLAHILNNTISLVTLNVADQTVDLLPAVKEAEKEHFKKACGDMTHQLSLVSDGVRSLLILTEAFRDAMKGTKETSDLEEILDKNLTTLKNEFQDVQKDNGE